MCGADGSYGGWGHGLAGTVESGGPSQGVEFVVGDAAEALDLGVDPLPVVDRIAATDLQAETLRSGEVERLHEPVVDRPEDLDARGSECGRAS